MLPEYSVRFACASPAGVGAWEHPVWQGVPVLDVDQFVQLPASSDHRPRVQARMQYDASCLYVLFRVEDRYVRSIQTEYQSPVYTDSCVEFFVKPKADKGYLNFESNCGGALLCQYIEDHRPTRKTFARYEIIPASIGGKVAVVPSMPRVVDPEIVEPVTWTHLFQIPVEVLESYVGPIGHPAGQTWRANFYKCANATSHPAWASWSPVPLAHIMFHQPDHFGILRFAPPDGQS